MKKQTKNIILSVSSKCISQIGDIIFDFTNNTFLASLGSHSISLVGVYQATESIIGILFNMIGGVIADNFKRKRIIIIANLLCGIACIGISFISQTQSLIYAIVFVNIILAIANSFYSPAYKAYTREIVNTDKINKLNSYLETSSTIVKIAFPIVSVSLYKLIGIQGSLILDGLSFILAAYLLSLTKQIKLENIKSQNINFKKIIQDLSEGIQYLIHHQKILLLILLSALINFFLAAYNLLLPYSNQMFPKFKIDLYAIFLTTSAIGGLLGAILNGLLNKKLSISRLIINIGLFGLSISITPIFYLLFNSYILLSIPIAFFNLFLTLFNIQFFSLIQQNVDNRFLGRVFGIIFTIAVFFMPVGTGVFSIILNVKESFNFTFIGIAIILLAIVFKIIFTHSFVKK